jgi:hypothetical protein
MASSERQVIGELLAQLEAEERELSARRRKLHDRIAIFTDTSGMWEQQEQEISAKRRGLHRQIDQLLDRADDARRAERDPRPSSNVTA